MASDSGKPQIVRLADVALIGPTMVLAAWELWRVRGSRDTLAILLGVLGLLTVAYNARNYLRLAR